MYESSATRASIWVRLVRPLLLHLQQTRLDAAFRESGFWGPDLEPHPELRKAAGRLGVERLMRYRAPRG